jgi:hypothetical protein
MHAFNLKNIESTKAVLHIVLTEGNHIGSSWGPLLHCISQVHRCLSCTVQTTKASSVFLLFFIFHNRLSAISCQPLASKQMRCSLRQHGLASDRATLQTTQLNVLTRLQLPLWSQNQLLNVYLAEVCRCRARLLLTLSRSCAECQSRCVPVLLRCLLLMCCLTSPA